MKKKRPPFKLEWVAHAYEYKERSPDWFLSMAIITLALAVTAIIFGNIIMAILILVAAFSLALFINREPDEIKILINERGITKGTLHYPYETIHSFHIDADHSHRKIMLRSRHSFIPLIRVPLGDTDAEQAHAALSQFLAEEEHSLPLVEHMLEFLGF